MKRYLNFLTFFLMSSSTLIFVQASVQAMKGPNKKQEAENQSSHQRKACPRSVNSSRHISNMSLPIPESFHRAAEFDGQVITPGHVLSRYFLLGSHLGQHSVEERETHTKQGLLLRLNKKHDEAKTFLEKAALWGCSKSMIFLGNYYNEVVQSPGKARGSCSQ